VQSLRYPSLIRVSYQVQSLSTEGRAHVSAPEEQTGIQSTPPASAAAAAGDVSQPDNPVCTRDEGIHSIA
jgi:hypothetical protein